MGLARTLLKLCPDWEKAQWLVDKLLDGCSRRPTPLVMRRVYCQKFPPEDGIEPGAADLSDFEDLPAKKSSGPQV